VSTYLEGWHARAVGIRPPLKHCRTQELEPSVTQSICITKTLLALLSTPHLTKSETVRSVKKLGSRLVGWKHDLTVRNGQKDECQSFSSLAESCQWISNQVKNFRQGESSAQFWPGTQDRRLVHPMVTGQLEMTARRATRVAAQHAGQHKALMCSGLVIDWSSSRLERAAQTVVMTSPTQCERQTTREAFILISALISI
jgi:hypothetical protein